MTVLRSRYLAAGRTGEDETEAVVCVPIFFIGSATGASGVGGALGRASFGVSPYILRDSRGTVRGGAGGNMLGMSFTESVSVVKVVKGGMEGTTVGGQRFRNVLCLPM